MLVNDFIYTERSLNRLFLLTDISSYAMTAFFYIVRSKDELKYSPLW